VARTERAVYRDIEEQARERDEARLVVTRAAAERLELQKVAEGRAVSVFFPPATYD
jgi:hypothetical protein